MNETKVCRVCKEAKPLSEFYPKPTNKYGVAGICKECDKARKRAQDALKREARKPNERKRIVAKPAVTFDNKQKCETCKYYHQCQVRIRLGFWMLCEAPDYNDVERVAHQYRKFINPSDVQLDQMFDIIAKEYV